MDGQSNQEKEEEENEAEKNEAEDRRQLAIGGRGLDSRIQEGRK